jgi:DNA-binding LytR/AlgR family response regulator
MNCLIVDDEVLAQDVLAMYISKLNFLNLSGRCSNALEAFSILNKKQVDLMFLDIKMPEISGLGLLRNLKNPPKVIITTAYEEYALEGYELDIVDYLIKPIRFERFLKAVQKVHKLNNISEVAGFAPLAKEDPFYVRSERKLVRVDTNEVRYIESFKNYLTIHIANKKIAVHTSLSSIEEELDMNPYFVRVHKSFIVNTRFIMEVDNSMIRLKDNMELPIGGLYKDRLLQAIRVFNS